MGRAGNKKILSGNCNYRHTILSGIVGNNKGDGVRSEGVYIGNTSDILPKRKDIVIYAVMRIYWSYMKLCLK